MEKNEEQKIWVTVSETVNTGNYESTKIEAGFSRIYANGTNPLTFIDSGINDLNAIIKKKVKKIRKKRNN